MSKDIKKQRQAFLKMLRSGKKKLRELMGKELPTHSYLMYASGESLTEFEEEVMLILFMLYKRGQELENARTSLTAKDLADYYEVSAETCRKSLKKLHERGLLKRINAHKVNYYRI